MYTIAHLLLERNEIFSLKKGKTTLNSVVLPVGISAWSVLQEQDASCEAGIL